MVTPQVVIAGAGPAGMILAYLLATNGVRVLVLEQHADFEREFRGDLLGPSVLPVLEQIGVLPMLVARGLARRVHFRFLISPIEFLGSNGELEAIKLERNDLYLDSTGTPRPRGTGETWIEPFQLALTAVGYRGVPIPGCPFDQRAGIVPNVGGRLTGADGGALPGLYAVGWAKRGPTGLIGDNVAMMGGVGVHHFVTIGEFAYISGYARIHHDVPPFCKVDGADTIRGLNAVGLRRAGVGEADIEALEDACRRLFYREKPFSVAMAEFDTMNGLNRYVKDMINFLKRRDAGKHGRYLESLRAK